MQCIDFIIFNVNTPIEICILVKHTYIQVLNKIIKGGIRLCDSLEIMTSEKSGKLAQNKTS